eukprot:jgi/Bigna1/128976/aug1.7_g3684
MTVFYRTDDDSEEDSDNELSSTISESGEEEKDRSDDGEDRKKQRKKKKKRKKEDRSHQHPLVSANITQAEMEEFSVRQAKIPYSRMQALMREIPTSRKHVFEYAVDWTTYDKFRTMIELNLAPFIAEKVKGALGQVEQSMIDFIFEKLTAHASPQDMFDNLQGILDEDAEVFVIKLYRTVIFEVEKCKL